MTLRPKIVIILGCYSIKKEDNLVDGIGWTMVWDSKRI